MINPFEFVVFEHLIISPSCLPLFPQQRARERERIYSSIKSERAGVKITPKTFLCMRVSHLSLHRESPAFSSIKSRLCSTNQSTHSLHYVVTELLHQRPPSN